MRQINFPSEHRRLLKEIGKLADKYNYSAYLVGGPVRDLLLGRTSQDIDIVCIGNAVKLAKKFKKKVSGKLVKHHDFPNATVKWSGGKIDFVTARSEEYPDGRVDLPEVKKTNDIEIDLKRRDFTVNAIACALNPGEFGSIVDPFSGLDDCNKRLIRVLHENSFREDPTRIFRAIRFVMKLSFRLEKETEKYLRRDLNYLKELTHERLWKEIRLCLSDGSEILNYLEKYEVLKTLDLNYPDDVFLERIDIGSVQFDVEPVNTLILALTENKKPDKLNFDKQFTRQMEYVRKIDSERLLDIEIVHELFLLEDYSLLYLFGKYPDNSIVIENFFDNREELICELDGDEILELGVEEGPEIGRIMNRIIEGRWIGKISNKEDETEYVKRYVGGYVESW